MRISSLILLLICSSLLNPLWSTAQVVRTIAEARLDSDRDGCPDDTSTLQRINGRITSQNFVGFFNGEEYVEIYFQDPADQAAIRLYYPLSIEPEFDLSPYQPGVELSVAGRVTTNAGVTAIRPLVPSFNMSVADPTVVPVAPTNLTVAALLADPERFESLLVQITNVTVTGSWPDLGSSANLTLDDGSDTLALRIDSDTDIGGQLAPTGTVNVVGIFSQFNTSPLCNTNGYQLLPRSYRDFDLGSTPQPPELELLPGGSISGAAGKEITMQLLGKDRNSDEVLTFGMVNNPGGAVINPITDRLQEFSWTPNSSAQGTTNLIEITLSDGGTVVTQSFSVTVLAEDLAGILLNEIHFDPAGDLSGDASGDGIRDARRDEFVEIVNTGTGTVDMSSWELTFQGTGQEQTLHTFAPGTVVSSETAVVVFGGPGFVGSFGSATVVSGPSTWVGLSNGGGTIRLYTHTGILIFAINYRDLNGYAFGNIDQSLTRNPDLSDFWDQHSLAAADKLWSPGTLASGAAFPGTGIANTPPDFPAIPGDFAQVGDVLMLTFNASDIDGDTLSFSISNAPPAVVFNDQGAGTATLVYTGAVTEAGTSLQMDITVTDGVTPVTRTLQIDVPEVVYTGLRINEILPDPNAGALHHDTNQDGVESSFDDEFVEVVNGGSTDIELAGVQIFDSGSLRHTFAPALMPTGGAFVVFGGGEFSTYTNTPAAVATAGSLSQNNGGDTVRLFSPSGLLIDQVSYSDGSAIEPIDAASITRNPDFTGDFISYFTAFGAQDHTTGTKVDGSPFTPWSTGPADDDNDGIPNDWESANGLDPNDDGTVGESTPGAKDGPNGALGDKDLDGVTNLDEYIADTRANDIDDFPEIQQVTYNGITVLSFNSSSEREYLLEMKAQPSAATWTPVGTFVAGNGAVLTLQDNAGGASRRVYRVGIRIP